MALFPIGSVFTVLTALREHYAAVRRDGTPLSRVAQLPRFDEFTQAVGLKEIVAIEGRYAAEAQTQAAKPRRREDVDALIPGKCDHVRQQARCRCRPAQPDRRRRIRRPDLLSDGPVAHDAAAFDPKNFPVVPPKKFSDFKVGDRFRMPSRTLTVALTSAFQAVSLDNNPLHYDDDHARQKGLPCALVQPMEVLAFSAPGASLFTLYLADILITFDGLTCEFLEPNFVGDTMYPAIRIAELTTADGRGHITTAVTIHNQKNEMVLTGQQKFTVKLSSGEEA